MNIFANILNVECELYSQWSECDLIELIFLVLEQLIVDRFMHKFGMSGVREIFVQIWCRHGMNWIIFGFISEAKLFLILKTVKYKAKRKQTFIVLPEQHLIIII